MCQVRIDFESLQLQNAVRTSVPTTNQVIINRNDDDNDDDDDYDEQAGECVVDQLQFVTSSGDTFGPICGTETDNSQHLYLGNIFLCLGWVETLHQIRQLFTLVCAAGCVRVQYFPADLGYDSSDGATITFKTNTAAPTSTSSRSGRLCLFSIRVFIFI